MPSPRPLSDDERAALLGLLRHADFNGRDELLAQVGQARVIGGCGCGCASVELAIGRCSPSAGSVAHPIPNEGTVLDGQGEAIGGLLLFVRGGLLRELEVYSHAGEPIAPFPPLERLRLEATSD